MVRGLLLDSYWGVNGRQRQHPEWSILAVAILLLSLTLSLFLSFSRSLCSFCLPFVLAVCRSFVRPVCQMSMILVHQT